MKLSLLFLVFVAVFQLGSSNIISKSGTQEQLLSDANAVQNGNDVIIAKPGPLDDILNGDELVFEVRSLECYGDFLVCYAPHPSNQNVLEDSCDTNSGFYITTLGDTIMEPIASENFGVGKSDQCFAPKGENGIVKLNIINATSECSVSIKNNIIKLETITATLGQLDQTSSGENEHASAATTDEPESFFDDYGWIFLILGITLIAIAIGIGVCCYLCRKNNAQKPVPIRRRKLQGTIFHFVTEELKRKISAIIKRETTTARPTTTTTLEQSDENAASTDEPESFFADYWRIFSIPVFIIIAVGAGVGVYCYLRRKKKAQKPLPVRRRKLQGSKSPVVLQPSTETQNGKTESAVRPDSLYNQSSILSHKSLLNSKKDEPKKEETEETDLTSMKPTACIFSFVCNFMGF
uniref:Uncharacterized protein n=1 Tax=Panagrolaimus davidi TaxID=227884 RepID=A0A914QK69_9BILA